MGDSIMKTKEEIITELKLEFPTLRIGDDDNGYINLSTEEYEATIAEWADGRLERIARKAEAEAQAQAKAELLERLGITADEAKLLLA
jgi:hypothetical protein